MKKISRRRFLQTAGIAAAVPAVPVVAQSPAGKPTPVAFTFFNPQEAAFVNAAVARLIPADETGPGALEADVPYYIDRQLSGAWGAGDRLYRMGPFQQGEPTQGYQLPYTPAELFRRAIRAINAELQSRGQSFAKLPTKDQDDYLKGLQNDKRDLGGVPANTFFESLLEVTIEGFFSDPIYGGNKDMVAWEMIGFPGAYADYYDLVGVNAPYRRAPMSVGENGRGQIRLESPPAHLHMPSKAPARKGA